jgi:hypothetical protein
MKQVLFWGWPWTIPDVATSYNRPFYSNSWSTTAARNFTVPVDTTFRKLYVKLDTAPWVWNSYTFTICNWVAWNTNTALAVTISWTDTEASNTSDEVVISAKDATQLKCTRTWTPTFPNVAWSVEAETDAWDSFITSSNSNWTVSNSTTRWLSTYWWAWTWENEDEARTLIPIHCTLKSYAINLNNSPWSWKSFDFDIFKNWTIISSTTLSVADWALTWSLWWLSINLAPWDFVSIRYVPVNTPTARIVGVGVEYVPDTPWESFFTDCIINNVTGTTRYRNFQWSSSQAASTDSALPAYVVWETDFTLTDYYVSMETAPWSGKTRDFKILKNWWAGNNSITVSDTNTSWSDLVFEDSLTKWDTFLMMWSSTGSPTTTRDLHNSIVCFIDEAPPPPPISIWKWGFILNFM